MVIEIPTPADFEMYGLRYLNLGWGLAATIAVQLRELDAEGYPLDDRFLREFGCAAEPELATAVSLVEQGVQFLLKGKIACVSPWLLISREPEKWPRSCDHQDVAFSDFHTIDGQDLVKVYNTFSKVRLRSEYQQAFGDLRRKRNALMHTVSSHTKATISEIFEHVLLTAEVLVEDTTWPAERQRFLATTRDLTVDIDPIIFVLAREFEAVLSHLPPQKQRRFLHFDSKRRTYRCPVCCNSYPDAEGDFRTAVLDPNLPSSRSVWCFVCCEQSVVERRKCTNDCKGNVIDSERCECLTCGHPVEEGAK